MHAASAAVFNRSWERVRYVTLIKVGFLHGAEGRLPKWRCGFIGCLALPGRTRGQLPTAYLLGERWHVHERRNQAQQGLLLWTTRLTQKVPYFDVR